MFDLNRFVKNVIAPQRSNRYSLTIQGRAGLEDIDLLAEEVTFPTFGYDKVSGTFRYGFGVKDSFPGAPEIKELIVTFIMQQGSKEHSFFHDWFDEIIRHKPDDNGALDTTSYTMAYKDDYITTLYLRLHSEVQNENEAYWEFIDVFPISITGESLAWEQSDTYLSYTVTFNYYAMKFIPGDVPVATEPRVRTKDGNAPSTLPYRTSPDPIDDSLEGLPQILGG